MPIIRICDRRLMLLQANRSNAQLHGIALQIVTAFVLQLAKRERLL